MTTDAKAGAAGYEEGLKGASEAVARFERRADLVTRIKGFLHASPAVTPLIVLVCALAIFGLLSANFFKTSTLSLILQQIAIVGILGCAQSLVILSAGIDLSIGAIAVFSSVLTGQIAFRYGAPPEIAILLGLILGAAMGAVNGLLVVVLRLPPFIATLGTSQIFLAANFIYSRNETIRSSTIAEQAPALQFWGKAVQIGEVRVLYAVFLLVFLVLFLAYVLRHTAWGRHVYAVGGDPEAAKLSGVRTGRVLVQIYALAGLLAALAGWVMIGRFGSVSPSASTGVLGAMQSITAAVIGGISLFGGRGSVLGMFFGALIVGVFEMGLRLVGADPQWTYLMIGLLVICAVGVDQWIRKGAR